MSAHIYILANKKNGTIYIGVTRRIFSKLFSLSRCFLCFFDVLSGQHAILVSILNIEATDDCTNHYFARYLLTNYV